MRLVRFFFIFTLFIGVCYSEEAIDSKISRIYHRVSELIPTLYHKSNTPVTAQFDSWEMGLLNQRSLGIAKRLIQLQHLYAAIGTGFLEDSAIPLSIFSAIGLEFDLEKTVKLKGVLTSHQGIKIPAYAEALLGAEFSF